MKKIIMPFLVVMLLVSTSFSYTDESSYFWARDAVNRWQTRGLISGFPDGTFRGNNYITRADLIIIANKLNNFVEKNNKRVAFDVYESDYFYNDMCTAVNIGIIEVENEGKIRPREYATREETMVIFAKLFNLSYGGNAYDYLTEKFIDTAELNYETLKQVAGFVDAGFISGYEDGSLRPKNNVTRAEVITMIDKMVKEVYSKGTYSNLLVNGSIIINGGNVKIKDSEIKGKIFIMDGVEEELPTISDTNIGQGISSRVGLVTVEKTDGLSTLTKLGDDEEYNEAILGYIRYDEKDWTNEDVRATLKLDAKGYKVINNNGKKYYDFEKNGEFIFECEKDGHITKFIAEVENIDKVVPIVKAEVTGSRVDVTVSDDGMSPIVYVAYKKGDVKASKAIDGIKIENNSFSVTETGEYTIAVEDEAGNIGRTVIKIKELSSGDSLENESSNVVAPNDGTTIDGNQTENVPSDETPNIF